VPHPDFLKSISGYRYGRVPRLAHRGPSRVGEVCSEITPACVRRTLVLIKIQLLGEWAGCKAQVLDQFVCAEPVLLPIYVNASQRRAISTGERKSRRPTEDTGLGAESGNLACVYVQGEMLKIIGGEGAAGIIPKPEVEVAEPSGFSTKLP
jgi:hypothetical protein